LHKTILSRTITPEATAVALTDYLSRERTLFLQTRDKNNAILTLIKAMCSDLGDLDLDEVAEKVFRREESISSRLTTGIAIPHAVADELTGTVMALGLSKEGIPWDPATDELVHVVLLLVGGQADHLQILSEIAHSLKDGVLYSRMVQAGNEEELYSILSLPVTEPTELFTYNDHDISQLTFSQARDMAGRLGNARLVLHSDAVGDPGYIADLVEGTDALVTTNNPNRFRERGDAIDLIPVPFRGTRRSANVEFTLLFLLSQERIARDEIVVNVFGMPDSGYFDSIRLTYVEHEFHFPVLVDDAKHPNQFGQHVLTRVLQLANELAAEGREGKAIGTLFVLGDYQHVHAFSRQLIVNPFQGMDEHDRNILDPSLEETLKEYAKIDGAFIIRGDGTIMSAGTYISGTPEASELHSGLGARHAAALGITAVSGALSVAISESTRKVSLFHGGKRIIFM